MAISIFAYSNPYYLKNESFFKIIENAFQLCASQTQVNGLVKAGLFKRGQLTSFTKFLEVVQNEWMSDALQIRQRAAIDNEIQILDLHNVVESGYDFASVKNSLLLNRSLLCESIRILFELGIHPDEINISESSVEQKIVVKIYRDLFEKKHTAFKLNEIIERKDMDLAIAELAKEEITKNNNDPSIDPLNLRKDVIVIHGIHQFTPLMLRFIQQVSEELEVIMLFNYVPHLKHVYQTWLDIYEQFEIKIELSNKKLFELGNDTDGRMIASSLSSLLGKDPAIAVNDLTVTEFANVTEFAGAVARDYEYAMRAKKNDINSKRGILSYMREQYYAADTSVNNILKVYFPDQFGERQFLDYPIGHFLIALMNMWNPENEQLEVDDLDNIKECLSCGVIKENNAGDLLSIFNRTCIYFKHAKTMEEIMEKLDALSGLIDDAKWYDKISENVSYLSVTDEEINRLSQGIRQLIEIARYFCADFRHNVIDFRVFYNKVNLFLKNQVLTAEDLEPEFRDIVIRVLKRVEEIKDVDAHASFDCLKETMQIYLQQLPEDGKGANWIVRGFEQIDGDVLRSKGTLSNSTIHFACLSDEDMNVKKNEVFPWPLDIQFFEESLEPSDWKYRVYITSKMEYRNFRRYALAYGLSFSGSKVRLSYVKNVHDQDTELYALFRILNANVVPYDPESLWRHYPTRKQVDFQPRDVGSFDRIDLIRFKVCPMKFLLESVAEGNTVYNDEFLLKQYMRIILRKKAEKRHRTNVVNVSIVEEESEELQEFFPFMLRSENLDVVNAVIYDMKGRKDKEEQEFDETCLPLENFSEERKKILLEVRKARPNVELNEIKLQDARFEKNIGHFCKGCSVNGLCLIFDKIGR